MFKLIWRLFLVALVVAALLVLFSMAPRNQLDTMAPDLTSNLRGWGKAIAGQADRLFQGAKQVWASVVGH